MILYRPFVGRWLVEFFGSCLRSGILNGLVSRISSWFMSGGAELNGSDFESDLVSEGIGLVGFSGGVLVTLAQLADVHSGPRQGPTLSPVNACGSGRLLNPIV